MICAGQFYIAGHQWPRDLVTQQNNGPKRHHFIPQMILRHFSDNDGQLWFWRRDFAKGNARKANAQNLFVKKDLYTFTAADGSKDVALEVFFSKLEGAGAKFISQLTDIIRSGETPKLDDSAWEFWGQFFYYHLKRTPGAIAFFAEQMNFDEMIDKTYQKIKAVRAETGGDAEEQGLRDKIRQNAIVTAQRAPPSKEVLALFETLGLAIYKIADSAKSFVVGDVPGATAKFRSPNGQWSHPTLFLPLTWDIAVGKLQGGRKVEIIEVDRDQVRLMNIATTARSRVIAGRSSALINSLSADAPYRGVELIEDPISG
jgi:Protein of unknown function (DUF4238)